MKVLVKNFLRREWLYLLFLVILTGTYLFLSLNRPHWHKNLGPGAYQAFLAAEKTFQAKASSPEELQVFFKKKPALGLTVSIFSGVFGLLFLAGCALDILLISSRDFRRRVLQTQPAPPAVWGAGSVLRVVVQFMAFSLLINLVLDALLHLTALMNEQSAALFHTVIMDTAAALLIVREIRSKGGSWKDLGFDFRSRKAVGEMAFGLGGYAAVIPFFVAVLALLLAVMQWLAYEPEPHPLVEIFLNEDRRAQWLIGFSIFLACVAGPFFEEIFFRGFCYPAFKKILGPTGGGLLSAVFFSLIHHNQFAFLPIFILGLVLVFLYEKRGNLTAPITLHFFHNGVFIAYFFIAKALMTAVNAGG